MMQKETLRTIYRRLYRHFGPQHWWPGETPLEVAAGAILAQNTAWRNAALAIQRLKEEGLLEVGILDQIPTSRLARLVRSSGYFNQKAKRLKIFIRYLKKRYQGQIDQMRKVPWPRLRRELLSLKGIGPETADSILLYALGKPIFVVDAYTRRILARHSWISWKVSYPEIQELFMKNLPARTALFNEYHALLVALSKSLCLTQPKCHLCPLKDLGTLRLETQPASP